MGETLQVGGISIEVTRKAVKNVHLSVHPPSGRVTLVVPEGTRLEVARAYAISKLGWIRDRRAKMLAQARETPRQFVERETHYLWGQRYLLSVVEEEARPSVRVDHRRITLVVRPGTSLARREAIMRAWQRRLLHEVVPGLIRKWERRLGVEVQRYYLQRMKTRWGSANSGSRSIRINTELSKKPQELLEYVVVHEIAHLVERGHGERFTQLMDLHWPRWRESRRELNELPVPPL